MTTMMLAPMTSVVLMKEYRIFVSTAVTKTPVLMMVVIPLLDVLIPLQIVMITMPVLMTLVKSLVVAFISPLFVMI